MISARMPPGQEKPRSYITVVHYGDRTPLNLKRFATEKGSQPLNIIGSRALLAIKCPVGRSCKPGVRFLAVVHRPSAAEGVCRLQGEIGNDLRRKEHTSAMRHTIRLTTAVVFVCAILSLAAVSYGLQIVKGPYLQNVTTRGITVVWETDVNSDSRVDYGLTGQYGRSVGSGDPVVLHEIVIDDLSADALFHYRVTSEAGIEQVQSVDSTFHTAVLSGTPFTFCALGDSRGQPAVFEAVCDLVRAKHPDFVLHSGDLVSDGYNYDEWQSFFFYPARELLRQIPMFTIPGNHERQHNYYTYFMSNPTESSGTDWYYSFDYGNAHFCMINTNDEIYGYGNDVDYYPGSPQYQWIVNDLSSTEQEWKIVVVHTPPYSSGQHGTNPKVIAYLTPLFAQYGVDLVFSGHDHDYERTVSMRGVVYVVSGGAGAWLYPKAADNWWSVDFDSAYHYCLIAIDGRYLSMVVRDINGQVIDRLRLSHSNSQFAQEHRRQVAPQGPLHWKPSPAPRPSASTP
jgi:predicted phosphodiesterase